MIRASTSTEVESSPNDAEWRDARPYVPYVIAALAVAAFTSVASILAHRARLDLAHRLARAHLQLVPPGAASHTDRVVALVDGVAFVATIGTAVVWLLWFVRVYGNAGVLWPTRDDKWVMWGWIIPFFALFKPFRMMNDAWAAGEDKAGRPSKPGTSPLIVLWWLAFLVGAYVDRSGWGRSDRFDGRTSTVGEVAGSARRAITGDVATVVAAVLAVVLVLRVTSRLEARRQSARVLPPSTGTTQPVTYDAAGDSTNAATFPNSAGSP